MIREISMSYGPLAPIVFILLYLISTVLFLPGSVFSIASGVIFGKVLGTIYTVIGATIGATLAFIISRYFARSFFEQYVERKFKKISQKELSERLGFPNSSYISKIEQFERRMDILEYVKICEGIGLNPKDGLETLQSNPTRTSQK